MTATTPRKLLLMALEKSNWEISFAGCGLLCFYHAGVGQCVQEKAPELLGKVSAYYGASAGAITAVMAACEIDSKRGFAFLKSIHELGRHWALGRFGVFHPRFKIQQRLREFLNEILPPNAHRMCRGRVHISLTVFPEMRNWLVTDFNTRAELISALVASSYIPFWGGMSVPTFRGKMCVDGGMSNNLPHSDNPNLITVSPFSGECDISPKESQTHHQIIITGMPAQICWSNVFKGIGALLPMSWEEVEGLYHQGQRDAQRYLEREGLLHPPPVEAVGVVKRDYCPSPTNESTSDYFSMTHSRRSSALPGLDTWMLHLDSDQDEEEQEEEERPPGRANLGAVTQYLNGRSWAGLSPSWNKLSALLHMPKQEQVSLLRSLWRAVRVLRGKMEQSLSSSSCEESVINCRRMLFNALSTAT